MSVSSRNSRLLLYSLPVNFQQGLTDGSSFQWFIRTRMQNPVARMRARHLASSINCTFQQRSRARASVRGAMLLGELRLTGFRNSFVRSY
jgi:hypothetical protein